MNTRFIRPLQMAFDSLIHAVGEEEALRYVQQELGYQRPVDIPDEKREEVAALLVEKSREAP